MRGHRCDVCNAPAKFIYREGRRIVARQCAKHDPEFRRECKRQVAHVKGELKKQEAMKRRTELEKENKELRAVLALLVNENIANLGTEYQFVACRTPEGNVRSWDRAIVLLGGKLHPKRQKVRGY